MSDVGLTVVGAGVVGLAVVARLAPRNRELVVVERHAGPGQETSGRNSEVVHAGLYYPTGSLKARLCVEGNRRLYELCRRQALPHQRCGKLVVATRDEELPLLEALAARGRDNGVPLERLGVRQVREREPHVAAAGALASPTTGIVSADAVVRFLHHSSREAGALFHMRAEVVAVESRGQDYRLTLQTPVGRESFTSQRVVNAAGLDSDTLAQRAGIDVAAAGYRLHYCKGSYFALPARRRGLVSRLIYPVPTSHSLGVHVVLGLDGSIRLGPDEEWLSDRRRDYRVDPARRAQFARAARRLLPTIDEDELQADTSGIRPKLQGPGEPFRDFVIAEESARGLPGWVNLVGIDSPGLTAALAIAEHVEELLG